jgi:CorA-like Mg2+ transporter protein
VPWRQTPPGAPPPLIDCGPDHPDAHVRLPDAVRAFFAVDDERGVLRELDGVLCARVVAGGAASPNRGGAERLDLALIPDGVVLRRRAMPETPHQPFDLEGLRADWEGVLPEQRDPSVLFAAILNQVIDGYGQVLDVIRTRADDQEGHLLDRDRPLREIQIGLLELTGALGAIRRQVLPLRNDLRELRELRDPVGRGVVSPAGARWLASVEEDLRTDLPEALAVAEGRIGNTLGQLQGERSEVTNRVVLALTIVTAAFYVPTVLTGLYGMNVPLPFQRHEGVFWAVVALAVALFVGGAALIVRYGLWRVLRRDALQGLRPSAGRRAREALGASGRRRGRA